MSKPREMLVAIPDLNKHRWDAIRDMPIERDKIHESVFKAYHVLDEVESMVLRGDSMDTIETFLRWVKRV